MVNSLTIEAIREKCSVGAIRWSAHSTQRMLQRGITRADVLACITSGEIIERYPDNWLNPACLILGFDMAGNGLHVVVGVADSVHVVTAYRPDASTFMPDMRTRKGR